MPIFSIQYANCAQLGKILLPFFRHRNFQINLFAAMFGFKQRDFFEVEGEESEAVKEPVKVDFSGAAKS